MTSKRSRHGFTLIELLVVIAIIGLLATLMVGGIQRARGAALRVKCLSNLRQMVMAANTYAADSGGYYPPAYARDFSTGKTVTWESYLWGMGGDVRVQQCPAFHGEANWKDDEYTGYNYNASYIGGREFRRGGQVLPASSRSATIAQVADPVHCALFGDGEYERGANKFMRSPFPGRLDAGGALAGGGTQGFRHNGKTNIGFADGHAESLRTRHTKTSGGAPADGCGFISADNGLYDLE